MHSGGKKYKIEEFSFVISQAFVLHGLYTWFYHFFVSLSSSVLPVFHFLKSWHCWELCGNGGKGFWHSSYSVPTWSTKASTLILGLHTITTNHTKILKIEAEKIWICQQPGVTFSLSLFYLFSFSTFLAGCKIAKSESVCACVWALNHLNPWPSTLSVRLVVGKIWCVGLCRYGVRHSCSDKTFPRHCESCVFLMGKENWKGKDTLFA